MSVCEKCWAEAQRGVAGTGDSAFKLYKEILQSKPDVHDLMDENARLRDALGVLLDQVDYTSGACRINEPIAGVLPAGVIRLARLALKETE